MTAKATSHPCLSCPLPDCDESSFSCPLRKAIRDYARLRHNGETVTDELRRRYSIAHVELYGWRQSQRVSGGDQ